MAGKMNAGRENMTASSILGELTALFRDCFDDENIVLAPSTSADDIPDWDSAKMVQLILAVEDRFAIRMRSREIDALRCVDDWVKLIEAHRSLSRGR
jgi:acyl carrier protein